MKVKGFIFHSLHHQVPKPVPYAYLAWLYHWVPAVLTLCIITTINQLHKSSFIFKHLSASARKDFLILCFFCTVFQLSLHRCLVYVHQQTQETDHQKLTDWTTHSYNLWREGLCCSVALEMGLRLIGGIIHYSRLSVWLVEADRTGK